MEQPWLTDLKQNLLLVFFWLMTMTPCEQWRAMVEAEHHQAEQKRRASQPDDYWRPYAEQFRANPRRTGDLLLDRLLQEVAPHHTVLDVGAAILTNRPWRLPPPPQRMKI